MCTCIEQLGGGARVYGKVLTLLREVLPRHPALSSLKLTQTANTSLPGWPSPPTPEEKGYSGPSCTSAFPGESCCAHRILALSESSSKVVS